MPFRCLFITVLLVSLPHAANCLQCMTGGAFSVARLADDYLKSMTCSPEATKCFKQLWLTDTFSAVVYACGDNTVVNLSHGCHVERDHTKNQTTLTCVCNQDNCNNF